MPVRRCDRKVAGDLLHLIIKKLVRFALPGHQATEERIRHPKGRLAGATVAIDEHSRVGFGLMQPDDTANRACQHLLMARRHGKKPVRENCTKVMADSGAACTSRRFVKLPCREDQAHLSQALHAAHQRQGRAVDSNTVA